MPGVAQSTSEKCSSPEALVSHFLLQQILPLRPLVYGRTIFIWFSCCLAAAAAAAAAAKSLQSCPTLCDPIEGLLPGSSVQGFFRQEHYWILSFLGTTWFIYHHFISLRPQLLQFSSHGKVLKTAAHSSCGVQMRGCILLNSSLLA